MQGGGGGVMLLKSCEGELWLLQLKNLIDYDRLFHALTTAGYECIMAADSPSESSSSSDSPFFTIKSPSTDHWEPGGVVLDDEDDGRDDGADVGEDDLENINDLIGLTIPIVERNIDGSERTLGEMSLRSCIGYYSFAEELSKLYKGSQPINAIAHVLWPWPGYETHYMADGGRQLDPKRIEWSNFSTSLRCIVVQIQPIPDNNVLPVHFQAVNEVVTECRIPRRFITDFKAFVVIVHMLWSSWKRIEPRDPWYVTDGSMVGGLCFIDFFDADGDKLDIPTFLSMGPWDFSEDENWDNEEEENDDNDDDRDNGEVEDENNNKERIEEEDENCDEYDNDGDDDDDDNAKDFLHKLASIHVRERKL